MFYIKQKKLQKMKLSKCFVLLVGNLSINHYLHSEVSSSSSGAETDLCAWGRCAHYSARPAVLLFQIWRRSRPSFTVRDFWVTRGEFELECLQTLVWKASPTLTSEWDMAATHIYKVKTQLLWPFKTVLLYFMHIHILFSYQCMCCYGAGVNTPLRCCRLVLVTME